MSSTTSSSSNCSKKSTKDSSNRKRFNDEQIKSLETTFETESRPELRLKKHLANQLGLQPRQVAIWFQNKRARSKSKLIERDYNILKSSYDQLAVQFDALRKENQALLTQLQRLRMMAEETELPDGKERNYENHTTVAPSENQRFLVLDMSSSHDQLCMPLCNDPNRKDNYLDDQEIDPFDVAQVVEDSSLASPENSCFESCTFLDDTGGGSSQWWDRFGFQSEAFV